MRTSEHIVTLIKVSMQLVECNAEHVLGRIEFFACVLIFA